MISGKRKDSKAISDGSRKSFVARNRSIMFLFVGLFLGAGAGTAQAAYTSSSVGSFTTGGNSYSSQTIVNTNNSPHYTSAYLSKTGGGLVPTGYMGANARSFYGTTMCAESGYRFNDGAANTISNLTTLPCGGRYYKGWGVVGAWNGSAYNYYYTYETPNIYGGDYF